MPAQMTERDMFNDVCKDKFNDLSSDISEVKTIALSTHKAICVSNGTQSVLSRLDKLEELKSDTGVKSKFGIDFKPIESRDLQDCRGSMLGCSRVGTIWSPRAYP